MTALEHMAGTVTKAGWSATWKLGLEKSSHGDYFALFESSNRSQASPRKARMIFKDDSNSDVSPKKAVKLFAHHYCLQMFTPTYSPYARLELMDLLSDRPGTLGERMELATSWRLEGEQWITGVFLLKFLPLEREELKYVLDTLHYQRIPQDAALKFCVDIFGPAMEREGYLTSLTHKEMLRLFFYVKDSFASSTLGSYSLRAPKDFVATEPLVKNRYPSVTGSKTLLQHYSKQKEHLDELSAEDIRKLSHAGPLPKLSKTSYELTARGLLALPRAFEKIDFSESTVSTPRESLEFKQLIKRLSDLLDSGEALSVTAAMRASGLSYETYWSGLFNITLSGYLFRYAYGRLSREKFLTLLRLRAFKLTEDLDFWVRLVESFAEDELSEEELRLALHLL